MLDALETALPLDGSNRAQEETAVVLVLADRDILDLPGILTGATGGDYLNALGWLLQRCLESVAHLGHRAAFLAALFVEAAHVEDEQLFLSGRGCQLLIDPIELD